MYKTNQTGRSMIEMLGVLAIIAVISAGALVGYSKAIRRHRLNETISQIALMVVNVHSFFGNQDSYEIFDEETAVKYNIATQRMIGSGDTLVNPYKGTVKITRSRAVQDGPNNTAFIITYRGLPVEACITLATTDWGHGEKLGFLGLSVGADDQTPSYPIPVENYYTTNKQMEPLSINEVAAHCAGSNPHDSKSVVSWKFF